MNKKYLNLKAVCFVDSTHTLLLYLLIYGKNQFESTFFFISNAISEHVRLKMRYYKFWSYTKFVKRNFIYRLLYRILLFRISYYKWPFLKKLPIYGHDHLWFVPALLKNRSMIVIEDGEVNYSMEYLERSMNKKHKFLYKMLFGPKAASGDYGSSLQAKEILLTNYRPIPYCIKNKTKIVNMIELWENFKDKSFVLDVFGLTNDDISILKTKKILILTQPMASIDVLKDIYGGIINKYDSKDVVLKTHPRETTDYSKLFPNVTVFTKQVPAELFSLLGIFFTDIYTITSTAIFSFPQESKKHYLGEMFLNRIINKYAKG